MDTWVTFLMWCLNLTGAYHLCLNMVLTSAYLFGAFPAAKLRWEEYALAFLCFAAAAGLVLLTHIRDAVRSH